MRCESFHARLMDHLERDADEATRQAMETHAAACAECGALLADLRELRSKAASLPPLAPSRDLWSGIAARIETPVVPIGASATAHVEGRGNAFRRWTRVGLMAASLVGAVAMGYLIGFERREIATLPPDSLSPIDAPAPAPAQQVAEQSPPAETPDVERRQTIVPPPAAGTGDTRASAEPAGTRQVEVQLAVAALSADYDREIARLRMLIEQRRSQLDPATVTVIERNLAVIDTAIAESRRALAADPASAFLIELLNQSLRTKVELMRTAALLPSRT